MELKEYQVAALDAFGRWLKALGEEKAESHKRLEGILSSGAATDELLDSAKNYPREAWNRLKAANEVAASAGGYVPRSDAAGRPIPHVCFKVPTGGGKTLLAAAALERMHRPNGLVVWIVPTKAIYQQTKAALWNREHPYRQMIERASGGRVKLLEKDDPFTASDVANYLCIMLLMLPAASRQKGKEFLRMFRDSGRYPSLFPDGDDALGDARLLQDYPDLELEGDNGPVKHSLFNALKMLQPIVILDEAHKAYAGRGADEFVAAVNRIDPGVVIELSATPHAHISNLLVDVSGKELQTKGMIKLPIQVKAVTDEDWRHTLNAAAEKLGELAAEAQSLEHSAGRYIRPIAVVRVERTGRDQRDGDHVHAEDVREHLVRNLATPAEAVRVKSAENDELGKENLLSETSPVRWIITQSALMEGWDCSFAYVLVSLDNTRSRTALTQLTGRVMRMPHARPTEREALDQCYVYARNRNVADVVEQVKAGLESDGMSDLSRFVISSGSAASVSMELHRREGLRERDIYLPRVLHTDGSGGWRPLDYDAHIISGVDWDAIAGSLDQVALSSEAPAIESAIVDIGVQVVYRAWKPLEVDKSLSVAWFARRLADLVPNPWQAARIARQLIDKLRTDLTDEAIYDRRPRLAESLYARVAKEVDEQARKVFLQKFKGGDLHFSLEASSNNYKFREKIPVEVAPDDYTLQKPFGVQMQLSLFEPVFERHFDSGLEKDFAFYLDDHKALQWWHRVATRQRGEYFLQGWRRGRIYPDFIAMAEQDTEGNQRLFLFETKGEHLREWGDTQYKREVLDVLQAQFNGSRQSRDPRGTYINSSSGPVAGTFRLVFKDDFDEALANLPRKTVMP